MTKVPALEPTPPRTDSVTNNGSGLYHIVGRIHDGRGECGSDMTDEVNVGRIHDGRSASIVFRLTNVASP